MNFDLGEVELEECPSGSTCNQDKGRGGELGRRRLTYPNLLKYFNCL